jgi:hypothetical protein
MTPVAIGSPGPGFSYCTRSGLFSMQSTTFPTGPRLLWLRRAPWTNRDRTCRSSTLADPKPTRPCPHCCAGPAPGPVPPRRPVRAERPRHRLLGLDRHKAELRPPQRLGDRAGLIVVVLAAHHQRSHVLGRYRVNPVPHLPQLVCPMMRAATGLHTDPSGRAAA